MFRHGRSCSALVVVCAFAMSGSALAQPWGDMCSPPKMKTDKWHSITAPAGMTLMIPQGYAQRGNGAAANDVFKDAQVYWSGDHRYIAAGSGAGPSALNTGGEITQTGECEAQIAGRRVEISSYNWINEDNSMSPSGAAGEEYIVVARFYSTATLRESFIAYKTNIQSDVSSMRQLFWTASFGSPIADAQPISASAAGSQPPPGATAATAAPACVPKPDPNLPAVDAVLDTGLVKMLVSNAAPAVPHGFEVIRVSYDPLGGVAGIAVSQSDLPDASQRQLTTLVASNIKQKAAKAPSTLELRVDIVADGLRYAVQPACIP